VRILLTNDDGYTSPGICLLAKALREAGHRVFSVAPDADRSGSSHSIAFLAGPTKLTEIEKDTYSCSGTPVDCIIVSLLGGLPELNIPEHAPDLVLSGINAGANLGTDITYSGTAAAARQASFFGIPSVALSLVDGDGPPYNWEPVISYITEQLPAITGHWKEGTFVNVNFPNNGKKPSLLVPVFHSMRYYNDHIERYAANEGESAVNSVYCFAKPGKVGKVPAEGSDWAEVLKGNAALSVVMTQPVALQDIK
jgi:5'-nucleotidase